MRDVRTRPLMRLQGALHDYQEIGETYMGRRRVAPVSGGTFEGERLSGKILPLAGADWLVIRPDGIAQLDVRLTLLTTDGATILMTYRGIRRADPDIAARLGKGEIVDPDLYYFRITPVFETADPKHLWLNGVLSVGLGERTREGVQYDIHEIL